jgi:methionyl-tRNA formyltransferase
MDAGLDTGDMVSKAIVPIDDTETGESLHDKLSEAGARLIVETLPSIANGTAVFEKQADEDSCYAKMLQKSMGLIDWNKSAVEIERLVRGLNSWPSAYTYLKGKTCKIWEAKALEGPTNSAAGIIEQVEKDCIHVTTGEGVLAVYALQLEGKKRVSVRDFMLGHTLEEGTKLG